MNIPSVGLSTVLLQGEQVIESVCNNLKSENSSLEREVFD